MGKIIKHANIIYMPTISALGGIETYVYELVKKYKDLDIAVVSKRCDEIQKQRLMKYCRVYIHTNQKIECKVCIINYDQSIISYINEEADIYQTMHADYSNEIYKDKPRPHPRIKSYIAITEYLQERMKEILKVDNVMMSYNPLTIEKEDEPIVIVTASRLHKDKGPDLMQRFADALDKAKVNYVWYIITNDVGVIESPNVVFIKNRLDISKWTSKATYGALFSKSEACSYFINEMLYRDIPMLVTPLPYLKEIGVEDGKNAYIVNFDGSNIDDVVNKIKNVPTFKFKKMEDKYSSIFFNSKSKYKEEKEMKYLVEATSKYEETNTFDAELSAKHNVDKYYPKKGERWTVDFERKEKLVSLGFVNVVEEIKEQAKEEIKEESKEIETAVRKPKVEKAVKKTTKKAK